VYGGDTLTDKMIDHLKKAMERRIKGLPFTSTSGDRAVADMLSDNTLFIIQVRFAIQASKSGISTQSCHLEEQDVLLTADYSFLVKQDVPIEQDFLYLNSDEKKIRNLISIMWLTRTLLIYCPNNVVHFIRF